MSDMNGEEKKTPPMGTKRPDPGAMFAGGRAGGGGGPGAPGRGGIAGPAGVPARPVPGAAPPGAPQRPAPARAAPGQAPSGSGGFGRFAVDYVVPLVIGLALAAAFYLLLVRNLPASGTWGDIRSKLADRGFIPYTCAALLFWHLGHHAVRYFVRIRPEFAALNENLIPPTSELTGRDVMEMTRRVVASETKSGGRFLTRRLLLGAEHLRITLANVELGDLLRHAANADRQRIESVRALPSFLFWAIPALGLAGTVGGIGAALGAASRAEGAASAAQAAGLGQAFDVLLVAVFMALAALLVQLLVQHSEYRLLADIEDHLNRNLQAKIRTESIDSRMQDIVGDAIRKLTALQEGVQKNQGEIMTGNMETVSGAQTAIREAIDTMPRLLDNAGEAAAGKLSGAVAEQAQVSRQVIANLDAKATDIAQNLGTEFNKVTSDLAQALREITERLSESFASAKELSEIQLALQRNLDELNKIHDLGRTFSQVKDTLAALTPVLASLNRPIPLRFTLEEGEIGLGGMPAGGDMVVR